MRKHLIIAGILLLFEAWSGAGILGMGCGIILVPVFVLTAIVSRQWRQRSLRIAGVYALLFVCTMAWVLLNISVAQRRAQPVIIAVNHFHSDSNRYPNDLDELVPAYLPSKPHGGFTYFSRNFHYHTAPNHPPDFYFAAMFHGIFAYNFATATWQTNE